MISHRLTPLTESGILAALSVVLGLMAVYLPVLGVVAVFLWALPLLVLARWAPPFYEYVESASDTTGVIGWSEAVRGDSSWLGHLVSGDQPWWPAAFALANEPVLVVVAAVVGILVYSQVGVMAAEPEPLAAVRADDRISLPDDAGAIVKSILNLSPFRDCRPLSCRPSC